MSPTVEFIYYALWFAHPALQLAVAGVMVQRKLHRKFPVFFAYILSEVAIFSVLFPITTKGSYELFFYAYWLTAAVSLVLGFYVIHELFLDVFEPYHTLKDLGTVLFKWAGLVMLLVAAVVAAASPVSHAQDGPLVQAVLTVQRCVRVIQCGLILFLLLFSRYLGVSWKQKNFGIALGFGFFASVELFLIALVAASHLNDFWCAITNMVAYNLSIAVWLVYMRAKALARDSSSSLLMSQRWDQTFMDLQHPMPADSLIPMFENMVEKAISGVQEPPDAATPAGAANPAEPTLDDIVNASLASQPERSSELANSAAASGSSSRKT